MLPFKVSSVVTCDDIRQEQNNKAILIGVYNGTLVVPGFPAELALCWWIQLKSDTKGHFDLEIRLIRDDKSIVLRALVGMEVREPGWASLALPKALIQLRSEGPMKLQLKLQSDDDWETIHELDVREGKVA